MKPAGSFRTARVVRSTRSPPGRASSTPACLDTRPCRSPRGVRGCTDPEARIEASPERVAPRDVLQVDLDLRACYVRRKSQRFVGRQLVPRPRRFEHAQDDFVDALGVPRSGRKDLHDQEMDAVLESGRRLDREGIEVITAILVSRRDDLEERNEAMAADMTDGQRTGPRQRRALDRVAASDTRRRFRECGAPRRRR